MLWCDPKELEGLVVDSIDVIDNDAHNDRILITTKCGRQFLFQHDQDCCEHVRIWDSKGDLKSLEGMKLVSVEQIESDKDPDDVVYTNDYRDCFTWTTIVFKTDQTTVISRWLGESNGYYSERVSLSEIVDGERQY
jgi:hypothetical protein